MLVFSVRYVMNWANVWNSIREFCELSMPVLMFDKDGNFHVLRLEQVCGSFNLAYL